ncbi:MAG: C25 family cysteine peptidase [Bacteroidales bacterium]|jgi:hypothetical protein
MKKLFLRLVILVLFLVNCQLNAQNIIGNRTNNPKPLIKESMENLSFSQEFNSLSLDKVNTEKGLFFRLFMGDDFGKTQKLGLPELPVYYQLIELPYGSEVEIEYVNVVTETYSLNKYGDLKLIPVQKSLSKSKTEQPFVINEKAYSTNKYIGKDLVSVEKLGYMGAVRLARLAISPIKYNPVTNTIEFVKSFDVNIKFANADIKATIAAKQKYNNQHSSFLADKLMNGKNLSATVSSTPINRPLKMIILSDPMFTDVLQPYIKWKREKGFEIVEVYKGQTNVGTTNSSMKSYLESLWNNATSESPAADYLLICGDVQQIPAFDATTDANNPALTDLYYAEYTGDFLPEVFYGRFSAQTVSQMEAIVNKTINYEKYLMQDTNYLKKTLLVGGKDVNNTTPTNGQMNYAKKYLKNIVTDTLVYYNPASGDYSTQILDSISVNGYSLINYSAHCGQSGWSSPSLTVTDINSNINNIGKFPLFINNCCLSGQFSESECLGEAILRANNKGGIGAIGGSNYTYWDEDYYWAVGNKTLSLTPSYEVNNLGAYDRLFHTNNEPISKWYITAGQMVQGGDLAVMQSNSNLTNYYWEIYHLMGDPSLMPYVGLPSTMINHIPDSLALGSSNISIQTQPYAFVGVSKNGVLLGASQANSNGVANINFNQTLNQSGYVKVVITNQFSRPIIDSIALFTPNYPLISINSVKYTNGQNQEITELKNNEEYFLSFDISNVGAQPLDSIRINTNNTTNLIFLDSSEYLVSLGGLSSITLTNAMKIKVVDGTLDKSHLDYIINIDGANNYFDNKSCTIEAFCPALDIENLTMTIDTTNSSLVGEEIIISFDVKNNGRNTTDVGNVILNHLSSNLSYINDSTFVLNSLAPNYSVRYSFNLLINSLDVNNFIGFKIGAFANQYYNAKVYDSIAINGNIETFETGDLTYVPWVNDSSYPWTIESSSANVYHGYYSLRSGSISDNQKSVLTLTAFSMVNDSISFYIKVSTESGYDFARFYIDNVAVCEKSGNLDWQKLVYPVDAGSHEFKWEYEKDYSNADGSDAVWIDNVKLPINGTITSIEDIIKNKDNIIVYPNPAKDFITVSNIENNSAIKIFDAVGRIYYSSNNLINNVNVSSFPNGVYYMLIKSDNNISTKKIIIAR